MTRHLFTTRAIANDNQPASPVRNARWVLKRALFGLLLMAIISTTAAVLLNAGIDPTEEQSSE
jgi:hypothetical protein